MDTSEITSWIDGNIAVLILLIGGILSVAIAVAYASNKDSWKYKVLMILGLVFGVVMAYEATISYGHWRMITSIIVAIAAFALIIRPFRDVHVAAILSLFVMVIIYIAMGALEGVIILDHIDLTMLSEGWPRIIVAFIAGALVYMITNFAEELVKIFGKFLNFWPVLLVLGVICVIEAVMMYLGYGSIIDYVEVPASVMFV